MVEVSAGLFLGSEDDAYEVVYGKKHKVVTHILSITSCPPTWLLSKAAAELEEEGLLAEQTRSDLKTLHVQADDRPSTDLLFHFEKCCLFIQQGLDHSAVLVHCAFGISRSTTVVLAYLMRKEGRRLDLVMENVRLRKTDIRPNAGFLDQLKLWGSMGCRIDLNHKQYKAYRLLHLSVAHSRPAEEKAAAGDVEVERCPLAVDPAAQEVESTAYYRCRKCRRLLFTEDSVLQHKLGKGLESFNPHQYIPQKPNSCGDGSNQSNSACTSYFIELIEWMEHIVSSGDITGKVLCPKCEYKLGSYNWSGQQCSCGQWMTPSFQVHKSRVDEVRSLAKRKTAHLESKT